MTYNEEIKLKGLPYVIGGLSFIPLLGVLFGVVAIVWGFSTNKIGGKKLAGIGACGILFTIILYGSLFYFGVEQRGGVYDDLRIKLAQSSVNLLVPQIEFYKVQNGKYPDSLKTLQTSLPKESFVSIFDPSDISVKGQPRSFYYELVGIDHYYLRGLGKDGKPFTEDDIVPQIAVIPNSHIGLLLQRETSS